MRTLRDINIQVWGKGRSMPYFIKRTGLGGPSIDSEQNIMRWLWENKKLLTRSFFCKSGRRLDALCSPGGTPSSIQTWARSQDVGRAWYVRREWQTEKWASQDPPGIMPTWPDLQTQLLYALCFTCFLNPGLWERHALLWEKAMLFMMLFLCAGCGGIFLDYENAGVLLWELFPPIN